ncbi:MAG: xanthine dehydrogenase family protein molybdopterin-binding subunit [Myxococcaceae bacterium]|nr:MAG: xanthine dehydrogenase family protein molybdopterin-binding subunit [Myxococcaceae bacterium]
MRAISRRELLAASGTGLIIAFVIPGRAEALLAGPARKPKPLPSPNAFLRIGTDDTVTVLLSHSEMGQGIWTTLPLLVAEELGCDWSKIRVEHAPAHPAYAHTGFGMQMTGGSTSTWSEYDRYRTVGALARELLVRAAAEEWKTDAAKLRVENGYVIGGSRRASFGQLAEHARALPAPTKVNLKPPEKWTSIGKPVRRLDSPEKITGRAVFGIDVQFPGLRTALVSRSPVFGGTLRSFDATEARKVPGVEQVVQVPSGVAVIATNAWSARLGRAALKTDWDLGSFAGMDTEKMRAEALALSRTDGAVAVSKGNVEASLGKGAKRLEADYEVPYLAHAPMEPLNCTVKREGDRCDVWIGTQFQTMDQQVVAQVLGLKPEQVNIHTTFLGGGFGRRATPVSDFAREAAEVTKAAGVPVKVMWTRDDDIRGGYYRPAYHHRVEAALDGKGRPVAWKHTVVGQSILAGTPFEAMMVKNGIDETSIEGINDSAYLAGVAARRVTLHSPRRPIPVLWWRSVGNSHTAFVVESMLDELAHAAGKDPLAFRLEMLKRSPRHAKVLKTAAENAGWGRAPAPGRARGLALHESFGSIVAQVAEVSIEPERDIRVHRVVCAVDCGQPINPLGIEAQIQGGIAFGLAAALHSQLTFREGRVEQSNFHDYQVLRIDEMPTVEVHIIKSGAKMGGIGEPGTPPIAPAVGNAVFALTGKRLRTLPFRLA